MGRLKLVEQPVYKFSYDYTVKVRDINYGNHLGNDALVGVLHEARIDMLHSLGCSELNLGDNETGLIMGDLVINFMKESFMHDELIVYTQVDDLKNSSFRVYYKVVRCPDTIALAETGLVAVNYNEKGIGSIPDFFIKQLNNI